MIAAGQGREFSRCRGFDQTAGPRDSLHMEKLDRLGHALDLLLPQVRTAKAAAEEPVGVLRANELAGCGDVAQPEGGMFRASPINETVSSFFSTTAGPV